MISTECNENSYNYGLRPMNQDKTAPNSFIILIFTHIFFQLLNSSRKVFKSYRCSDKVIEYCHYMKLPHLVHPLVTPTKAVNLVPQTTCYCSLLFSSPCFSAFLIQPLYNLESSRRCRLFLQMLTSSRIHRAFCN